MSFGFRYGLPSHADLVLDVRFLPNPYFIPELKPHPGTDPRVASFVLGQPDAKAFLDRLVDLCGFLLPRYRAEGKSYLTIAIGCTGGQAPLGRARRRARRAPRGRRQPTCGCGTATSRRSRLALGAGAAGGAGKDVDGRSGASRRTAGWRRSSSARRRGSCGPLEQCAAITPRRDARSMDDARARSPSAIERGRQGEGVLVLTDMFGGTPANLALTFLDEQVEVVTGVNLPMLLKLATARGREPHARGARASSSPRHGQKNITLASELLRAARADEPRKARRRRP